MFNNKTTPTNSSSVINLDYMDMMADGDVDMKKTMLEMLLEEIPVELTKMREVAQANNWGQLSSVSHKMKSTLSFVGNDTMTNANKELEQIGKTQEGTEKVNELITLLETTSATVLVELQKVFDTL